MGLGERITETEREECATYIDDSNDELSDSFDESFDGLDDSADIVDNQDWEGAGGGKFLNSTLCNLINIYRFYKAI